MDLSNYRKVKMHVVYMFCNKNSIPVSLQQITVMNEQYNGRLYQQYGSSSGIIKRLANLKDFGSFKTSGNCGER